LDFLFSGNGGQGSHQKEAGKKKRNVVFTSSDHLHVIFTNTHFFTEHSTQSDSRKAPFRISAKF